MGTNDIRPKRILFTTHIESGQANTILATALEASMRPHVEVHIASFPALKPRVERLSSNITFHSLDGKDMTERSAELGYDVNDIPHPPTTKSLAPFGGLLAFAITCWDGEGTLNCFLSTWLAFENTVMILDYIKICDSIKKVIIELDPNVVVVDTLFNPGMDACYTLNRKFVANSPNTPLDMARSNQPWLKGFWYYPMFVHSPNLVPELQPKISFQAWYWDIIPDLVDRNSLEYRCCPWAHLEGCHVTGD